MTLPSPARLEVQLGPDVQRALARREAVVALESTVLTHGLPRPVNHETALALERIVRHAGATPATIAVLDGRFAIGLGAAELERVCTETGLRKLNRRDLAAAVALGWAGGTTVSATMALAHAAGIEVFATGGIGGVHRGNTGDVSADLEELAQTPITVVCSGAKSILDLDRTLEWLETRSVPVVGWQTDEFPEFVSPASGRPVSLRMDDETQAVRLIETQRALGSGVLICVPCPAEDAVPGEVVLRALRAAEEEAAAAGVSGKDLTPFLLGRLVDLTGGATLRANTALLRNNALIAARVALALAESRRRG
jgi:pseudouridine-5'-phosphate glycosidase